MFGGKTRGRGTSSRKRKSWTNALSKGGYGGKSKVTGHQWTAGKLAKYFEAGNLKKTPTAKGSQSKSAGKSRGGKVGGELAAKSRNTKPDNWNERKRERSQSGEEKISMDL